jgi:predicted alpha-1,2-mannosidase
MKPLHRIFIAILLVGIFLACTSNKSEPTADYTQYVNPFTGTGGAMGEGFGNTFPGAASPFGMIQVSPDNGGSGWQYASGYHYEDEWIAGFSHLHCSGTGVGDLHDISLMPTTKEIKEEYFMQSDEFVTDFLKDNPLPYYDVDEDEGEVATFQHNLLLKYRSKFTHEKEKASPGYYFVNLLDDDIDVELTATEFAGMHRYTFNEKGKEQHLILDLGFTVNRDKPVKTVVETKGNDMITGYRFSTGWAKDQRVYFAMKFSRPFKQFQSFMADEEKTNTKAAGSKVKGVFTFDDTKDKLLVKVAISSASVNGAIANLGTADKYKWDFDNMYADTKAKWNKELGKIKITTENKLNKRLFYTSLYHSFLVPYRFSDIDGYYKGYDNKTTKAEGYTHYTILSIWDTFRALKPLLAITQPELYNDIIQSMLSQYKQTGSLPYWEIMGNEGGSMIGFHAVSLIADAIFKGIDNFDKELAYEAMIAIANTERKGLHFFREYGYVPTDKDKHGTVSKTVEYCYNDWCLAQVAKYMGKDDDYKKYMASSENYRKLFDPEYKLMRGKKSNGEWYEPFHPRFSQYGNAHFVEGNSWHYSWFVPQNIDGMVEMFGGSADFEMMLDSLFDQTSEQLGKWTDDVTGLIGQYAHGNEPSHHVAYLYNYIGKERKTQYRTNQILTTLYKDEPSGICGNEDCGQMSAWYVFSSLGFYPVNPISGKYDLSAPLFDKSEINLPNGKVFTVIANNISDKNIYAKSVKLNGKLLKEPFISYEDLMNGGTLVFEMTE